jgi:hypothetical protein
MKKLMMAGGLFGFLIGLVFGLVQNCAWPSVLWRSSVAALCAGLLMRWWGRLWLKGLGAAYRERSAVEVKAAAQPALTLPLKP